MMAAIKSYYWDTCVFIAHLSGDEAYKDHLSDISQFLREAQNGECAIYCSTITIAEITRSNSRGTFDATAFESLWGSGVTPIFPDVTSMRIASELRSLIYVKTGGNRKLGTPDAIHLASALALSDAYGIEIEAFHTFDRGNSRDVDGKGVPLIGYEDWTEVCADDALAKRVIDMNRCNPEHPSGQGGFL